MVFPTSKRPSNNGQMLRISPYKERIAKGAVPQGMSHQKVARIQEQVAKLREQIEIAKRYVPFTSNASKRRARQVGA